MPRYILLLNYTDEGIQNVQYMKQHIIAFRKVAEAAGGRMPKVYLTMGQYDLIAVIEAPSDEACVSMALTMCSVGNVRSTTLKAFTDEEITEVVEKIPSLEEDFSRIIDDLLEAG